MKALLIIGSLFAMTGMALAQDLVQDMNQPSYTPHGDPACTSNGSGSIC